MNPENLKKAIALGKKVGYALVATADRKGTPHLAVAGKFKLIDDNLLAVEEWFCPGTVANLGENRRVSVVFYDRRKDAGYQLLGEAGEIEDCAVMDGYVPDLGNKSSGPQVEKRVTVRVKAILDFKRAPHNDIEE